jgi:hypothetical protein
MEERRPRVDAEEGQRLSEEIDTASGPGPVLDQDEPDIMPLFSENERANPDTQSVIDPAEFAQLGNPSGEELDGIQPIGDTDELGVAGRAAQVRPETDDVS